MHLGYRRFAFLLLAASLLASRDARAVNLVPNDSFETISQCPGGFGWLFVATPWDVPTAGTSDCYNVCVTGFPSFPVPGVPGSPFGFQFSRTGDGHAGIIVKNVQGNDYREYLQVPLNAPLVANATYEVKFYVNLADTCDQAVDRLGAYLSVGVVGPFAFNTPLPLVPQVESPAGTFLDDTVGWTLVSGSFVAAGGEDHLVIGNFHDDATTATQLTGNTWPGANYNVDDVSVELQGPTLQACCGSDGQCQMLTAEECQLTGGSPMGPGVTCDVQPCQPTASTRRTWGGVKTIYR